MRYRNLSLFSPRLPHHLYFCKSHPPLILFGAFKGPCLSCVKSQMEVRETLPLCCGDTFLPGNHYHSFGSVRMCLSSIIPDNHLHCTTAIKQVVRVMSHFRMSCLCSQASQEPFLRHMFAPEVTKGTVVATQYIGPQTIPLTQDILIYCQSEKTDSNQTISIRDGMSRFVPITSLARFPAPRPGGLCSLEKNLVPTLPALQLCFICPYYTIIYMELTVFKCPVIQ